ncbi:hypothetical protein ABVT39_025236 [Epinephelus coioides]
MQSDSSCSTSTITPLDGVIQLQPSTHTMHGAPFTFESSVSFHSVTSTLFNVELELMYQTLHDVLHYLQLEVQMEKTSCVRRPLKVKVNFEQETAREVRLLNMSHVRSEVLLQLSDDRLVSLCPVKTTYLQMC